MVGLKHLVDVMQGKLLEIDIRLAWKLSCLAQQRAGQSGVEAGGILTCCQDPLYFEEMLLLT